MLQYSWVIPFVAVVVFYIVRSLCKHHKQQALLSRHRSQERRLHEFATELRCLRFAIRGAQSLDMQVPFHLQQIDAQAALLYASVEWLKMTVPLPVKYSNDVHILDSVHGKISLLWNTYYTCAAVFQLKESTANIALTPGV